MGNLAGEQQLLGEALRNFRIFCQFRPDALERDDSINVAVIRLVNRAHTADAQHLLDLKPAA